MTFEGSRARGRPCLTESIALAADSQCPSSGSELDVLPSLSPDSSDTSEELPRRKSSLASKYSAVESATEGGLRDERLPAAGSSVWFSQTSCSFCLSWHKDWWTVWSVARTEDKKNAHSLIT